MSIPASGSSEEQEPARSETPRPGDDMRPTRSHPAPPKKARKEGNRPGAAGLYKNTPGGSLVRKRR